MKKLAVLLSLVSICSFVFAQSDFMFGTKYKNSITSIYYTYNGYKNKIEYRYGLYDEIAKKNILPMKYNRIWDANEDGIFAVEDTTNNWSLYSIKTNTFILKSEYKEIKPFSDGLAIVSKNNDEGVQQYGAVDKTGRLVIPIQYKYLGNASEGLICFSRDKGYGYIDRNNKEVIAPLYRSSASFKSGLACVSLLDSNYYGYIDKNNKWIITPKYLRGSNFKGNNAIVFTTRNYTLNSDNAGVIDKDGNVIVPLEYDYINVEDNFYIVKKISKASYTTDTKYGVFDLNGKIILPIEYTSIGKKYGTDFYETQKASKYGLIDNNGKFVTNTEYDYIYTFADFGISYLKKDNKYTIVDKTLKTIVPDRGATNVVFGRKNKVALIFKNKVEIYNETGKLVKSIQQENVSTYGTEFYSGDDSIKVNYNKTVYLYDIITKQKEMLDYTDVSDFNENGIFFAKKSDYDLLDYTGKKLNTKSYYGVVNFSENIAAVQESLYGTPYLIDKSFTKIKDLYNIFEGPYSEGLAKAKKSYGDIRYYYDKKGNVVITLTSTTDASNFKNGRAYVKQLNSNKYYFIDKSGKKINSEEYEEVGPFSDYLAGVKKDGKIGFIDTAGKTVIPFQYDAGSGFTNGVAMVRKGNEFYLIDTKGNKINREVYNGALNPVNSTFPVQKGINFGLINEKGKTIIDFKYDEVAPMSEGVAWVKKSGKWALINDSGKAVSEFIYDTGNSCKNGYIIVGKEKKLGLLDKTGRTILPVEYDNIGSVYNNKVLLIVDGGKKNIAL